MELDNYFYREIMDTNLLRSMNELRGEHNGKEFKVVQERAQTRVSAPCIEWFIAIGMNHYSIASIMAFDISRA